MMNDDERFDEILRKGARDYNQPPAIVPRDAMWEAIETAHAQRALRPLHIVPRTTPRPLPRYIWLGAAAAAVLLVATGVGIGRWTSNVPAGDSVGKARAVASTTETPAPSGERAPGVTASPLSGEPGGTETPAGAEAGSRQGATPGSRVASGVAGREGARRVPGNRVASGSGPYTGRSPDGRGYGSRSGNGAGGQQEVPYQVATIRHLANAEALLTAFRTDSRDAKMDAQLATWARDLLSNTRLLLDSPAGDDPQRARLLGDLELVLAQIVQLSPGTAAQDRVLIEGSIRSGQVMTRLRSAIPAGPTRGL